MTSSYDFKFDINDRVSYKPGGNEGKITKIEIDINKNIKYTVKTEDGSELVTIGKYLKEVL